MRSLRAGLSLSLCVAAACGRVDTSGMTDGPGEPPANCDADGDGFFHPHPSCDDERGGAAPDCNDNRDDVHPGATVVCGDGAVNSCIEFGNLAGTLGVAEVGLIAEQDIYRTSPDGFFNNIAIAAEEGNPPTVLMVGAESASTVRLVEASVGPGGTTRPIIVNFPTGYQFANHNVDIARLDVGAFAIGTVGIDAARNFLPVMGVFSLGAVDFSPRVSPLPPPPVCPDQVDIGGQPFVIRGLDDAGHMFYELEATNPQEIYGVAADLDGNALCRPLRDVGVSSEFGSQLSATGTMAIGRSDFGLWVWEEPINYDDLNVYSNKLPLTGVHTALARNTQAGDPVLLAYRSDSELAIEAIQCTGLNPCTPISNTAVTVEAGVRDLVFAPVASGAMLVEVRGDFSGPTNMVAQLLDADGNLLAGGAVIPLGTIQDEYRSIDAAVIPPGIGHDYYDIFVGYAVADTLASQHEMRVRQVRACQDP